MPHHLMNLRHVPDDEAEEIRALFDAVSDKHLALPTSDLGLHSGGALAVQKNHTIRETQDERG